MRLVRIRRARHCPVFASAEANRLRLSDNGPTRRGVLATGGLLFAGASAYRAVGHAGVFAGTRSYQAFGIARNTLRTWVNACGASLHDAAVGSRADFPGPGSRPFFRSLHERSGPRHLASRFGTHAAAVGKSGSGRESFSAATAEVDSAAMAPLPRSSKVYVTGFARRPAACRCDASRSPTHRCSAGPSAHGNGHANAPASIEPNPPIYVYDTSGPYTDPTARIDIRSGLPALRAAWIAERDDTEELSRPELAVTARSDSPMPSSRSCASTCIACRSARRAGRNVTQMHYARQGIVTPEMEYVAIRENLEREAYVASLKSAGPTGQQDGRAAHPSASGPVVRRVHPRRRSRPSSSATRSPVDAPSSRPTSIIPRSSR